MIIKNLDKKILCIFLAVSVLIVSISLVDISPVFATSVPTATGKIDSKEGAILRSKASTKGKKITCLKNNKSVTIKKIVFVTKTKTSAKYKWYYVTASGKSGYVRSDLVDNLKFSSVSATTTDALNYRQGAGTKMKIKGTFSNGKKVSVTLAAKAYGSSSTWYRVKYNGSTYYALAKYLSFTKAPTPAVPSVKVKVVRTIKSSNCSKMQVKGTTSNSGGKVPQGLAYDGTYYYVLFAMDDAQYIAKYSSSGSRKSLTKMNKNYGHLNGMSWDPVNEQLVMTKGNQKTIYTYKPSTGKFGTASTGSHSNSGIGYDRVTGNMIFSSKSLINVYKPDGKYSFVRSINRCVRSGTYYVQDCCAHNGFAFHCISTGNKTGANNYIDVYRISDSKYLGTINITMGETESAVVGSDGYLRVLVNKGGQEDYIWKTNLKVTSDMNL